MDLTASLRLLKRTLLRREKSPDIFLNHIKGVIHIGANTGQERLLYASKNLTVFWIEPIPSIYEVLCQNIKDFPGQHAICALLLDRDGVKVKLNIANNEGASSSVMLLKEHRELWPDVAYIDAIELTATTLPTLVNQGKVCLDDCDALILDTQGSELMILQGAISLLPKIKYILIEVPDFEAYAGCPRLDDFNQFMKINGFRLVAKRAIAASSKSRAYYDVLYRNCISC
ncbi:MAG: FkbM family methyltransferase [Cyanobacteriota bacterium]|jgi:FkbM family methyltransferase